MFLLTYLLTVLNYSLNHTRLPCRPPLCYINQPSNGSFRSNMKHVTVIGAGNSPMNPSLNCRSDLDSRPIALRVRRTDGRAGDRAKLGLR